MNRLPTRDLLVYRRVALSIDNAKCVFCGIVAESRDHSLFKCNVVKVVWREIVFWIGKSLSGVEEECLSCFMDWLVGKLGVVWLAVFWIFLLSRNGICMWITRFGVSSL